MTCIYQPSLSASEVQRITSPNNQISVAVELSDGQLQYRVNANKKALLSPSAMGFEFKNQPALYKDFDIVSVDRKSVDNTWQRVWGPNKSVQNHYNEMRVNLQEKSALKRKLSVVFRVFDDGIGFRYQLPIQPNLDEFNITSELTQFAFADDFTAWSAPADFNTYEQEYKQTPLSEVGSANTPITLRSPHGQYLSIHEAALTDYSDMTLLQTADKTTFKSNLVPWPDGIKVKGQTPFNTPWRTIQIADSAANLINSDLIINLNEPTKIKDTSWIKPMKYLGIWWGMHMRKYTWEAGPKHGATTENTKMYIDFAAENNLSGVLVEGWNQGWETWHTAVNKQDFTKPYPDFDIDEIVRYADSKGVGLIGHHETGGNIPLYEAQLEAAFEFYHKAGVHSIKTGYAGNMLPEGTHKHSQYMVRHYRKVLELAAKYKIMVNAHEPIKDTGISRTYPNMMTREGARGMEWNGWSEGNSPEHTVMLPFTRMLSGPVDYTPGIFNILFDPQEQYRVHTTLAKQLAMFINLYSPMQMASDMIENYQGQPAFKFIKDASADWDESIALNGEIGDYVTIARRADDEWFVASMTDENARQVRVPLSMLGQDTSYVAEIYSDALTTDFLTRPTDIEINRFQVTSKDVLEVAMANGGGMVVRIYPMRDSSNKHLPSIDKFNRQAKLKLVKFKQGGKYGGITEVEHLAKGKTISLAQPYDKYYVGGSQQALVDGILGNSDYKTLWQGYRMKDIDAVIDLGSEQTVKSVAIGFLQSSLHSILLPTDVEISVSSDGKNYRKVGQFSYHTTEDLPDFQRKTFTAELKAQSARYIKVFAKNLDALPKWHVRPGQEVFIFADEIIVK